MSRHSSSNSTTRRTPPFSSSSRRAAIATRAGGARTIGRGSSGNACCIRRSGLEGAANGIGAACSSCYRCRWRGPSMSAGRKRMRSRDGGARGCLRKRSSSALRTNPNLLAPAIPLGQCSADGRARCLRLQLLGPGASRQPSRGPQPMGRGRPGRQRLDLDCERVCPLSRVLADAFVPGVLGRLF